MSQYQAQLLAVEARLAKDPENEELLSLKSDLMELIELSSGLEETIADSSVGNTNDSANDNFSTVASGSNPTDVKHNADSNNLVDKNSKRIASEAEILAKKKEKNRKKKAKLRERVKEQLDIAESEKQSWQSFASKKGLKGVNKKSIFASPCSVTGKVGVGTNGIADAPSATVALTKRKY